MTKRVPFEGALLLLGMLVLAGCGDKRIAIRYTPEPSVTALVAAGSVTIFQFEDRRGTEGDNDPYRVGGLYGGYGNRIAKVMADAPFQRTLANALAEGFRARGVQAKAVDDRVFQPGGAVETAYVLFGEVRNFSTEARFANSAHVSGIVRLADAKGTVLVEKTVSQREIQNYGGAGILTPLNLLEDAMNKALAKFVAAVVNDPDISAKLAR